MLTLLASLVLSASPLSLPVAPQAGGAAQEATKKAEKPYKVGSKIEEEITLVDLAGEKVSIFQESFVDGEEKLVALVFWSLRDPRCHKYRKRLEAYQAKFAEQGVKLYLVASSYDEIFSIRRDPLEDFKKFVKKEKFTLPILIDHQNKLADDLAALTSNHAFVIDKKRYLRFAGGIDNDPEEKLKDRATHWLKAATASLLEGKRPKDVISRPIGRKIKRAPKKLVKDG